MVGIYQNFINSRIAHSHDTLTGINFTFKQKLCMLPFISWLSCLTILSSLLYKIIMWPGLSNKDEHQKEKKYYSSDYVGTMFWNKLVGNSFFSH